MQTDPSLFTFCSALNRQQHVPVILCSRVIVVFCLSFYDLLRFRSPCIPTASKGYLKTKIALPQGCPFSALTCGLFSCLCSTTRSSPDTAQAAGELSSAHRTCSWMVQPLPIKVSPGQLFNWGKIISISYWCVSLVQTVQNVLATPFSWKSSAFIIKTRRRTWQPLQRILWCKPLHRPIIARFLKDQGRTGFLYWVFRIKGATLNLWLTIYCHIHVHTFHSFYNLSEENNLGSSFHSL